MKSSNPAHQILYFDRFAIDLREERLRQGEETVALTPKAFAVLAHLVRHAGQRLGKDELLDAVWGDRHVSEAVLKVAVREIRSALEDHAKNPRYIETLHRFGYRFIAQPQSGGLDAVRPAAKTTDSDRQTSNLIGREQPLAELHRLFAETLEGRRRTVFVTGEPGIGKTALTETFLREVFQRHQVHVAVGHCLEQLGTSEAYQPILESLTRMAAPPWRPRIVAVLRQFAPTWLTHLPALIDPDERLRLQQETLGATGQRMLREMAEALEALAAERPLVLLLEDLHWSDYATLDLISLIARRPESARIFVIATFRPADARLDDHPVRQVKRELESRRLCHEIPLGGLAETAIADYLEQRFDTRPQDDLPRALREHTLGNPLFLIHVVDSLIADGILIQNSGQWRLTTPLDDLHLGTFDSVRHLIERQIDRLPKDDQRLLEAASVLGIELSAAAVASALGRDPLDIEEQCDRLTEQHQFLVPSGSQTLPNGTVTARYTFVHSFHQQVLYARLPEARQRRFHQRVALGGETVYGEDTHEIAAELALHFERGHDELRAVKYLRQAARAVLDRHANREADVYLSRALQLVDNWDETTRVTPRIELLRERALVRRAMGRVLDATADFESLVRYSERHGDLEQTVEALLYWMSTLYWISREDVFDKLERAAARANELDDPRSRVRWMGHCAHWRLNLRGWSTEDAEAFRVALVSAREEGDPRHLSPFVARDVYLCCWQSDYVGAARSAAEGIELARAVGDPFDLMLCKFFESWALLHAGHWRDIVPLLEEAMATAEKNGHRLWALMYRIELAWLHALAGRPQSAQTLCHPAIEEARRDPHKTGQLLFKSLIVLGLTHLELGQPEDALQSFREVRRTIEDRRVLMDQILELPLLHGMARAWLQRGRHDSAHREAQQLAMLARASGERSYLALAHQVLAEIALDQADLAQAQEDISRALAVLEDQETPLAALAVHRTATRIHQQVGRQDLAHQATGRAAAIVQHLADQVTDPDLETALRERYRSLTVL